MPEIFLHLSSGQKAELKPELEPELSQGQVDSLIDQEHNVLG